MTVWNAVQQRHRSEETCWRVFSLDFPFFSCTWNGGRSFSGSAFRHRCADFGSVADIALDEARGRLYVANFAAYRVEIINTASKTLMASFPVPAPPTAVAVSPNSQFLVVGEYEKPVISAVGGFQPNTGGLDTYDINTGNSRHLDLPCPVLTVTFGSDANALVVCRNPVPIPPDTSLQGNIFLLNPITNSLQTVGAVQVQSADLSLPLATAPGLVIQASAGVSGDLNTIVVLAGTGTAADVGGSSNQSVVIRYSVPTQTVSAEAFVTTPPFGPRVVSLDQTGFGALVDGALRGFSIISIICGPSFRT